MTQSMNIHHVTGIRVSAISPSNAHSVTLEIKQEGGNTFSLTLFDSESAMNRLFHSLSDAATHNHDRPDDLAALRDAS